MKNKGKTMKTEQENNNIISNSNYFPSSSDLPCIKHPSNTSSIGICAYCLNEKLIELICLECGEQRLCSCSCSDLDSYRNSSCNVDVASVASVGSVGRMSFLIENEKNINNNEQKTLFTHLNLKLKQSETEDIVLLKRSNSCVVEVKKSNGFWRFSKFFKKKREKECGVDQRSEDSGMDVTRSRSVSNACSSAKMSDFNELELRKSGFKRGFVVKESDFSRIDDDNDDDEFIDLKIDLSNRLKTEDSVLKCDLPEGGGVGSSSCRIMVNERGIKKVKNGHTKAWKWMFKHHSGKNDFDHILES